MSSPKVVIVSGGAHGIGEASALAFAREGYRVAVADIDRAAGEKLAAGSRSLTGEIAFIQADVSRSSEARDVVQQDRRSFWRRRYPLQ